MKPVVTWILIADSARARVVASRGPGKGVSEVSGLELSQESLPAGDIMADKPGRSFESAGTQRHAMEYHSDPVRLREQRFAQLVADRMAERARQGDFDRLVIVAAPRALGDLRKALGDDVKARVLAELDKDLTGIANDKLASHLEDVLVI